MTILVLAGKSFDIKDIHSLLGDMEYQLTQHEPITRGVRQLESTHADAVILIPDPDDTTWARAMERIHTDYNTPTLLISQATPEIQQRALDLGAFDAFDRATVTPSDLSHALRYAVRQQKVCLILNTNTSMTNWLEKTGRFGSWEMNADGVVTWSRGVQMILGSTDKLTGDFNSIRQFVLPEDLEIYDAAHKATFQQGWPLDFEYRIQREDHDIRHLYLHRRVELDRAGKIDRAYGMVRDVTSEREFEHHLFKREAIVQVVGSFAARFLRESDWQAGMNDALKDLGKATGVTRAYVVQKVNEIGEPTRLQMQYEWAAQGTTPLITADEAQAEALSQTYQHWRSTMLRRRVVAGNVRNFKAKERRFFESTGAQSILTVPIFVDNQWWGFIGMSEHREERDWMPVEIESLTMVADIFGSSILRRRMEDQLLDAKHSALKAETRALEASRTKSRFLANMSHEIRTPISGILGMAEMTITTGLTEEQRDHMDMIRKSANSLLSIVNDVLDISKIEADKMELKHRDFDFHPAIDAITRPFATQVQAKGVVFQSRIDKAVPTRLHGDPDRLGQILINLLGNAIKFTERGLIEINIELLEAVDQRTCLLFSVRDTGEGIPANRLDTVFESFTQADNSVRKKHQGTGLGLTISRELVEMMGGTIGVESEEGRGSTFSFTAWFDAATSQTEATPKPTPSPSSTLHLNLLLAEDNPLNQKFLTHFLSMFGHTVTVAGNGIEALELLKRKGKEIDLILMDIQMPEMGGLEATKIIRQSTGEKYPADIPIIALTAYAMKGDRERILQAGLNDYITKPVDMKALSAAIARNAARSSKANSPSKPPNGLPRARHTVSLNMQGLMDRFEGDMTLLKDIFDLFLIEANQTIKRLDQELLNQDLMEIGPTLHSITNLASHVLAMDIVEQSRTLEKACYKGDTDLVLEEAAELRPRFHALISIVKEARQAL